MIKKDKVATWLTKITFVVALFFSSDVVWHAEGHLPEASLTELIVANPTPAQVEPVVNLPFYKDTCNPGITFSIPFCILFRVQDHNRILDLKFDELNEKRTLFNAVLFIPALIYHTDKFNSHFLNA